MALPTVNDVGAVDPVLTNMLVAYVQDDSRFVASRVFPAVAVEKDSGTYYLITKKYFFLDSLEERAPGGDFPVIPFGVSTATYTTLQWAAEMSIADEVKANSQVPMDLEQVALRRVAQASLIRKENLFATDFMKTGVWGTDDNNSTTDWDDFASGDPVKDVLTASRTISNATGYQPNALVLGAIVDEALRNHPDIIDRLKYTQAATRANIDGALAAIFGAEQYLVARSSYSNTNENVAFSASAIVDDDCLVCHINAAAGVFGASAGKTFAWPGGGGMGTIYRDPARRNHSDVFQHKEQWDQKAVATDLGYFYADVV
jgi:hypothetical protein